MGYLTVQVKPLVLPFLDYGGTVKKCNLGKNAEFVTIAPHKSQALKIHRSLQHADPSKSAPIKFCFCENRILFIDKILLAGFTLEPLG